jgi:addiction module RelE/StbE family toxin
MFIITSKNFDKKFKKLPKKVQLQAKERILLFINTPTDPRLNNHLLHGDKKLIRSININGDLRLLFEDATKNTVRFLDIDTHSNLY